MFWDCFYMLCEKAGIKPNPLARDLGISSGSITKWKNGGIPNGETLIKIADYFGCSVDYLLGREDKKTLTVSNTGDINNSVVGSINSAVHINSEMNDIGREIINVCNSLDIKSQVKVLQYAYELEDAKK